MIITYPLYLYNPAVTTLVLSDVGLELGSYEFFEVDSEEQMQNLVCDSTSSLFLAIQNSTIRIATSNILPTNFLSSSDVAVVLNTLTIVHNTFFIKIQFVFINESNYVETTITDERILNTSNIMCMFADPYGDEISIQNIVCGVKSTNNGSCVLFAGTSFGASGTYVANVMVVN